MRSTLVLVLALGGCDQVFQLDRAESPDAPVAPDGPAPSCGNRRTLLDDQFTGGGLCAPWGIPFESGTSSIEEGEGELQIRPRIVNSAGCASSDTYAFPRGGLIAEVIAIAEAPGAYTSLNFGDADSIQVIDGSIYYATANSGVTKYGMAPFDAATMRWWRIHAENGMVIASHSKDGVNGWTTIAERPVASPEPDLLAVLAGLSIGTQSAGVVARFGRLLLCE